MSKIGDLLVNQGLLSRAQLREIQDQMGPTSRPVEELVLDRGMVEEGELVATVAAACELPAIFPLPAKIPPEFSKIIPTEISQRCRAVAFAVSQKGKQRFVHVALADPTDEENLELLRERLGRRLLPFVASPREISRWLARGKTTKLAAPKTDENSDSSADLSEEIRALTRVVKALRDVLIEKRLISLRDLERHLIK